MLFHIYNAPAAYSREAGCLLLGSFLLRGCQRSRLSSDRVLVPSTLRAFGQQIVTEGLLYGNNVLILQLKKEVI